MKSSYFP